MSPIFVGTAGWSIPSASSQRCGGSGTHLQRYARVFNGAEINSSFHRAHAATTYARWADSTPPDFRFAVKLPKQITHVLELRQSRALVVRFLAESAGLGAKRGPLLVQLPPSLAFNARVAGRFFGLLREHYAGGIVCEPRHASWFDLPAEKLLVRRQIARVAADPPPVPGADAPGAWAGLTYFRLHGSPRKYWSSYSAASVAALAARIHQCAGETWCVFDNTASGAALENAWHLRRTLGEPADNGRPSLIRKSLR